MKFALALTLLCTLSCGRVENKRSGDSVIGQVRSLVVSPASSADRSGVTEICQALIQKESAASTLLNTTHQFATTQTNCDGTTQGPEDVTVTIQQEGSDLIFRRSNNSAFIFPQVETTRSGVLAELCGAVSNLTSPLLSETEALYFTTSAISTSDCLPRAGERCILLERALVSGTTATVQSREWLRVLTDVNQGRIGFVNFRRKVSRSFCPLNQVISQSASLK